MVMENELVPTARKIKCTAATLEALLEHVQQKIGSGHAAAACGLSLAVEDGAEPIQLVKLADPYLSPYATTNVLFLSDGKPSDAVHELELPRRLATVLHELRAAVPEGRLALNIYGCGDIVSDADTWCLRQMKAALPEAPVYLHPLDTPIIESAPQQGASFGMACPQPPKVDVDIHDGDVLEVGNIKLKVMHTPGHAPGHVIFHSEDHGVLFGGDLVFQGSIGRTDFPGCDVDDMQQSLRLLLTLPAETQIFPGHMGFTTVADEKASNPFLQGL